MSARDELGHDEKNIGGCFVSFSAPAVFACDPLGLVYSNVLGRVPKRAERIHRSRDNLTITCWSWLRLWLCSSQRRFSERRSVIPNFSRCSITILRVQYSGDTAHWPRIFVARTSGHLFAPFCTSCSTRFCARRSIQSSNHDPVHSICDNFM